MQKRLYLPLLLLLALSLACNALSKNTSPPPAPTQGIPMPSTGNESTNTPQEQSPPPTQPASTAPTDTPSTANTPPDEVVDVMTFAQEYKLHIVNSWQPEGGSPEQTDVLIEHTSNPPVDHSRITSPDGTVETYQTATETWLCTEGNCFYSQDTTQEYTPLLNGEDMGASYFNNPEFEMQEIGRETINGIATIHYRVNVPASLVKGMAQGEMSNLQSEAWVADESGLPRFVVRWSATWDEVRGEVSGHSTLLYDVQEVNTGFSITLPETNSGENATGDVPVYPGAQQSLNTGDTMMYITNDDVDTVTRFYADALSAQGWTMTTDSSMAGVATIQTWTKGDQTLTLTITHDESSGGTGILINIQ